MIVAVASGKGGTGKTSVAVGLALTAPAPVMLLDCDVEAPNANLFLRLPVTASESVTVPVPRVDSARCTGCGACGRFCRFGAIVAFGARPLVFPELCHACGGCARICPATAIVETGHAIGTLDSGASGTDLGWAQGRLAIGQPMAPPLIRAVRQRGAGARRVIVDAPPGTACNLLAATRGCDLVLLVAEPTPFGRHDLELTIATLQTVGLPLVVAINRAGEGDDLIEALCAARGVPIVARFPDDRRVAEAYARGDLAAVAQGLWRTELPDLWRALEARMAGTKSDGNEKERARLAAVVVAH